MEFLNLAFAMLVSYIIGSVPTGYIIAKLLKGIDIRQYGSGNIGATNLMRVAGKAPGIAALLIDVVKGMLPVVIISSIFYDKGIPVTLALFKILLGLSAICGHVWTMFLRFKGGKGVATTIGVFIGLAPLAIAIGLLVWLITAALSRYVSISSIVMATSLPLIMFILGHPPEYIIFSAVVALFILYTHTPNIKRLMSGTEYKIGQTPKN